MKLLALVDATDHVCCRYRVRAFEPALAAAGVTLDLEELERGPLARAKQLAGTGRHDVALLQRRLLPGWQLAILRRAARGLVFDFDDALLYRDSYDPRGPHCPRRRRRFAATVRVADRVLAGNAFLAQCAVDHGARSDRVEVIPTCVDTYAYPSPPADLGPDGLLRAVWVGSSSTLQGLERSAALWSRLGRECAGLTLRLIADRWAEFPPLPVERVVWSEATETTAIASGDAGVSWLPDDLWSRGKCGLKVLQYMAAGLPVLANPVGVHPEMVVPGGNGFLPGTDAEWVEAARTLMANPRLRREQGLAGRRSVERGYGVDVWADAFVRAVTGRAVVAGPEGHRAEGAVIGEAATAATGGRLAWRRS
jgi:glycosyltransferase involved in cell wall biosynthesis